MKHEVACRAVALSHRPVQLCLESQAGTSFTVTREDRRERDGAACGALSLRCAALATLLLAAVASPAAASASGSAFTAAGAASSASGAAAEPQGM